jgi:hypothetical protein
MNAWRIASIRIAGQLFPTTLSGRSVPKTRW